MQADGTIGSKDATKVYPVDGGPAVPVNPPVTTNNNNNNGGGRGRGEVAGMILSQVLSNLPQRGGQVFESAPVMQSAPVQYIESAPAPVYAPQEVEVETATADLVLVDIKLVSEATALAGPAYSLTFSNQGLAATSKFVAAAILSDDGSANLESPKAAVQVPGMRSGETREITLRLPRGESNFLVLALDLNDTVTESDKDNNIAVVERAE